MENTPEQPKEEVHVDFGEDNQQAEALPDLAELESQFASVTAEQEKDMQRIKELAAEVVVYFLSELQNKEKIEAVAQIPTNDDSLDEKSICVKQVDYSVTTQELLDYFSSCGTIERLKILTTRAGFPKGQKIDYFVLLCRNAYIQFADADSVKSAMMFNGQTFHGRQLIVEPKRKSLPRHLLNARGRGRGRGYRGGYRPY